MRTVKLYYSGTATMFYTNHGKNHRANTYLYPKFLKFPRHTRAEVVTEYVLTREAFRRLFEYNKSDRRYELREEGRIYLHDVCIRQTAHYTDCFRTK